MYMSCVYVQQVTTPRDVHTVPQQLFLSHHYPLFNDFDDRFYTNQHLCHLLYDTSLHPQALPSTMAQLLRTAKSGSDWTANELAAYNHHRCASEQRGALRNQQLSRSGEPSLAGFMTAETRQDAADKNTRQLLHLDLAMDLKICQEAAVDNFAAELLRNLDYDDENGIVFIRYVIRFLICGENSVTQTDV